MKKLFLLVAAATAMMSCSMLKSNSSASTSTTSANQTANQTVSQPVVQTSNNSMTLGNTSTAISSGQTAGSALLALYNQYKADGNKYDYKNLNNVINCLQLVNACEGLKTQKTDKTYLKDFGKGMLITAAGLVTESNVNSVTNQLTEMVTSNETVTNAAASMADKMQTAANTAASISSILSMFAGK